VFVGTPHMFESPLFAADMLISKNGALRARDFFPPVMRSAARLRTNRRSSLFRGSTRCTRRAGPALSKGCCSCGRLCALLKRAAGAARWISTRPEAEFVIGTLEKSLERLFVRQSRGGSHYRGKNRVPRKSAVLRDEHVSRKTEAINMWCQRTQIVR